MPLQTQTLPASEEARFDLDTVKRAAALAAKLQEQRQNTLSQSEVDALATEAGIDPVCMRMALDAVHREQAVQQLPVTSTRGASRAPLVLWALVGTFLPVLSLFVLYASRSATVEPQAATVMAAPVPVTQAIPLGTSSLLQNGDLRATTLPSGTRLRAGSTRIPGWKVGDGAIRYERLPTGDGSVLLEPGSMLQQLIPTMPGASYRISWDLAGIPGSEAALHRVALTVRGADQMFASQQATVFTPAGAGASPTWTHQQLEFQARDAGTRIRFEPDPSRDGINRPMIAHVRVVQTTNVAP